jgi:DMSO/TMAO reductase YedYZ molybdopterin-dependent catalytic subunit
MPPSKTDAACGVRYASNHARIHSMTRQPSASQSVPALPAALAGAAAGALALGVAELLAGLLPGAASPIVAVGDLVISLQPPGAKQFVVDLFGEADKLVLNLFIAAVAVGAAALGGVLARRRPWVLPLGAGAFGILALFAGLRDPLADPITTLLVVAAAVLTAVYALPRLLRMAGDRAPALEAEMPAWGRRRFIGTSIAAIGLAAVGGVLGRSLLERGRQSAQAGELPRPTATAPPPPDGAELDVEGITPLVTRNVDFYRIDTALLIPRPDINTWRLRVIGMVDREIELTYDELLAMPLVEQYVTIACVSNEVGGDLVGNALWRGVRLKELLQQAGVDPAATQIVGRAVDGFTVGIPTGYALADDRESLVAVGMNGEPLPADHGFPARLIVPGLFGYVSATKWLTEIELTTWEGFDAYWVPLGWAKEGPILTQSRVDVPGDGARLEAGEVTIAGVAWAPDRGISAVEVQVDEAGWQPATISAPISDATWVQFRASWDATPGDHIIRVRATDGDGEVQTDQRTRPAPDGARGQHTIRVSVG